MLANYNLQIVFHVEIHDKYILNHSVCEGHVKRLGQLNISLFWAEKLLNNNYHLSSLQLIEPSRAVVNELEMVLH